MKKIFISCVIFTTPLAVHAAGFALIEQSASGMGNAFAGGSAIAEDASTIFFNPAGMTFLPDTQFVISGHAINPSIDFSNNGSHNAAGLGGGPTAGGNGGDAGDLAFVPNLFFTKAITPDIRLGIGLSAPFGLKTEYDNGWVGRYQTLKTELNTININPSIAFKASDKLSLGFGVSAMRADATLTSAVDFGTLIGIPQLSDGTVTLKGDNWAWGWNAGAIFQVTDDTRLGVAYRSQVHQKLDGTVSYGGVPAPLAANPVFGPLFATGPVSASITLPDSLSASVFSKVSDQWDVMGDVTFTQWSTFKNLTAVRSTGAVVTSIPENWENTYRISAGASYHYSDALKLRGGLAFDESPVPTQFRTPRIPDNNRTWLAFGGNYKFNPENSIDVGYTHIFVNNSNINNVTISSAPALQNSLIGSYSNDIDILSAQYTHNF